MTEFIHLNQIARNDSTQVRANGTQAAIVSEYAQAMRDGSTFPPVQLYNDGETYWIADGFHRTEAAREAGMEVIEAEVLEGTQREARLAALAANEAHGLRRTNEDRRNAVREVLSDPEWSQWSDRALANACKVTHPTVAKVRAEMTGKVTSRPATGKVTRRATGEVAQGRETQILSIVSDDSLVDECRRRGLEVCS